MKYILCDTNEEVVTEFQKAFKTNDDIVCCHSNITELFKYDTSTMAFVTTSDCLGNIDHGTGKIISNFFPGNPDRNS